MKPLATGLDVEGPEQASKDQSLVGDKDIVWPLEIATFFTSRAVVAGLESADEPMVSRRELVFQRAGEGHDGLLG